MEAEDTKRVFKLVFATDEVEAQAISKTDVVIVWPAADRWNDQGHTLLVNFASNIPLISQGQTGPNDPQQWYSAASRTVTRSSSHWRTSKESLVTPGPPSLHCKWR